MKGNTELVAAAKAETVEARGNRTAARRTNALAKSNPTLAKWLAESEARGPGEQQVDIGEVLDVCLTKIIAATPEDELTSGNFVALLSDMETHKAKIAKMRADTESVMINVATPTALRKMFNEFGTCIMRGNEAGVEEVLATCRTEAERELVIYVGGTIYQRVMERIQQKGQEDPSLSSLLSAVL